MRMPASDLKLTLSDGEAKRAKSDYRLFWLHRWHLAFSRPSYLAMEAGLGSGVHLGS